MSLIDAFAEYWTDVGSISKYFRRIGLVVHMEEILCYWQMHWNWMYHDSNPSTRAIWTNNRLFVWCFSPRRGCMPEWDLLTVSVGLPAFLVPGENWPEVTSFLFFCYQVMNKLALLSTLGPRSIFCCWLLIVLVNGNELAKCHPEDLSPGKWNVCMGGWTGPLREMKRSICIASCHL